MATAVRGPLSVVLKSPLAQWAGLGCAVAYAWLDHDRVLEVLRYALLASSSSGAAQLPNINHRSAASPIVVQVGRTSEGKSQVGYSIFTYAVGAGAVLLAVDVLQNVVSDRIRQFLPVTRKVFDGTAQKLAAAVRHVKDVLDEKIVRLLRKQDELAKQQDETSKDVKIIKADVRCARSDLSNLSDSVNRCENSLDDMHRLQKYTARGVQLLLQVVQTLIPRDHSMFKDLRDYEYDWDVLQNLLSSAKRTEKTSPVDRPPSPEEVHLKPIASDDHHIANFASSVQQDESFLKSAHHVMLNRAQVTRTTSPSIRQHADTNSLKSANTTHTSFTQQAQENEHPTNRRELPEGKSFQELIDSIYSTGTGKGK